MRSINVHADAMEVMQIDRAAYVARSDLMSHLSRRLEEMNRAISSHAEKAEPEYLHLPRLIVQRVRAMTLFELLADTVSSQTDFLDPRKVKAVLSLVDGQDPAPDNEEESQLRNRLKFVLLQLQEQIESRLPRTTI